MRLYKWFDRLGSGYNALLGVRGAKRKTAEQNGNMSVMTFMVGGLLAVSQKIVCTRRPMGEPWVIDCLRLEVGCWLSFPYSQVVSCQRIEIGP